jgi:hypothetical protein
VLIERNYTKKRQRRGIRVRFDRNGRLLAVISEIYRTLAAPYCAQKQKKRRILAD